MTERDLFLAALQNQDATERLEFLQRACDGDVALRQRVEALLREHEQLGNFLETPAVERAPTVEETYPKPSGMVIGPYRLLEQLGEGGFGVVWLAEQTQPVRRKVALKLIKPGMDSKQVVARFEAERQALALMDHPNIAHVLDAGTTQGEPGGVSPGRPYVVMELVRGIPITQFCDENHLSPQRRLELFAPVCQAVQHAHTKGIIHRDLKPGNVLVTLHDGAPVVKVIDFGIAKALGQSLTDKPLVTGFAQLIGTPPYMSPEQAEQGGLDVDTRSDIYSLGVLLYELLTGTTPFESVRLRTVGYDEMRRILREEEPPKPSTRLRRARSAERGARSDKAVPRAAIHAPRWEELDWMVMKALEKDRERRYETASAFGADVLRYLHDEPVLACPPSLGYRLRKFVRRNQGVVLAASLVVLALVSGIIGTTWGMIRAEQARATALSAQLAEGERAEGERQAREEVQRRLTQIEKGTDILASVFLDFDPEAAEREGVSFRVVLARRLAEVAQQLEGEAVGDPLVVARLQHVLGVSLYELGHREQGEGLLVQAGETRQRLLGADHLDTAATKHYLALLYRHQGEHALAETLLEKVLAVRTTRLGADHHATLASQQLLAMLYDAQGKDTLAERLYKEVLAIRTTRLGADHSDTLTTQYLLARFYRTQGNYTLAETLGKEVLAIRTAKLGADHLDTVASKGHLALLYYSQGKYALAETLSKEVLAVRTAKLGADHPDTVAGQQLLAVLYQVQEKYALAETLFKEVLAIRTAKLGADDPATLGTQHGLAALYASQGKTALAETLYREALAVHSARRGPDHSATLHCQYRLAKHYWDRMMLDQSIPLLEDTLKRRKANLEPDHALTLETQITLGANYADARRFAEAIALLEEVHRKGRKEPDLAWAGRALLTAYVGAGKTMEATVLVAAQVRTARQRFPADSVPLTDALADLGQALLDAKAYGGAELLLREVLSFREKTAATFWATHQTQSLLGAVFLGQQQYAAAEPLLLQGHAGLKERAATIPSDVKHYPTEALERLVQLYDAWGKPDEAAKWRKELKRSKE